MAAHLYWRINVTANNGSTTMLTIAEVQMRAVSGGADQCTGGTATASSSESGNPPSLAVDDSVFSTWAALFSNTTGWWQYQFASAVDVVEYTIQGSNSVNERAPKDWTLEYSDDGSSWTVADTRTGETGWTDGQVRTYSIASSTLARLSQLPVEVLRTNLAVKARVSQEAVEVLRPNAGPAPTAAMTEDFEDDVLAVTLTTTAGPDWYRTTAAYDTGSSSLRAGVIGAYGVSETSFPLTVDTGNVGTLFIRYRTDSEANYDLFRVLLDGVEKLAASGYVSTEWRGLLLKIEPGAHTVTLRYSKDASGNHGNDTVYVDNIEFFTVASGYATPSFTEDFEDESFSTRIFPVRGTWVRTTAAADNGTYAYRPGVVPHGGANELVLPVTVPAGGEGTFSLRYRTSSESGYDKFRVLVDGGEQLVASGVQATWSSFSTALTGGEHTVTLQYAKDGGGAAGDDTVYIDNIAYTVGGLEPTLALYAQEAVEVLTVPDPDPLLVQVAVEALILQHVDPKLAQVAVEVMTRTPPDTYLHDGLDLGYGCVPFVPYAGDKVLSLDKAWGGQPFVMTAVAPIDNPYRTYWSFIGF